MNSHPLIHRPHRGFAILEIVLAVGICGITITSIAVAMQQITRLSADASREAAISRIIGNELFFTTTSPRLIEGQTSKRVEEWDIEIETHITRLQEVTNQDNATVHNLYKIEVKAVWWEDNGYTERTAETWRYAPLYAQ